MVKKKVSADQYQDHIVGSGLELIEDTFFSSWPLANY